MKNDLILMHITIYDQKPFHQSADSGPQALRT